MNRLTTTMLFVLGGMAMNASADVVPTIYATLDDPDNALAAIAVDMSSGTLYVGSAGETFPGPGFPSSITSPVISVSKLGDQAIRDPDAIIYDAAGVISGAAGSVIVGGTSGIFAILPDNSVELLLGPFPASTEGDRLFNNPTDFVFDSTGRLLFTDHNNGDVRALTGSAGSLGVEIVATGSDLTRNISVDSSDNLYVTDNSGAISIFDSSGALVDVISDGGFYSGISVGEGALAGIYALDETTGELVRFDDSFNREVIVESGVFDGTYTDTVFGPDGSLFVAQYGDMTVWQVVVPAPSSLAVLGLGAVSLRRRRR